MKIRTLAILSAALLCTSLSYAGTASSGPGKDCGKGNMYHNQGKANPPCNKSDGDHDRDDKDCPKPPKGKPSKGGNGGSGTGTGTGVGTGTGGSATGGSASATGGSATASGGNQKQSQTGILTSNQNSSQYAETGDNTNTNSSNSGGNTVGASLGVDVGHDTYNSSYKSIFIPAVVPPSTPAVVPAGAIVVDRGTCGPRMKIVKHNVTGLATGVFKDKKVDLGEDDDIVPEDQPYTTLALPNGLTVVYGSQVVRFATDLSVSTAKSLTVGGGGSQGSWGQGGLASNGAMQRMVVRVAIDACELGRIEQVPAPGQLHITPVNPDVQAVPAVVYPENVIPTGVVFTPAGPTPAVIPTDRRKVRE